MSSAPNTIPSPLSLKRASAVPVGGSVVPDSRPSLFDGVLGGILDALALAAAPPSPELLAEALRDDLTGLVSLGTEHLSRLQSGNGSELLRLQRAYASMVGVVSRLDSRVDDYSRYLAVLRSAPGSRSIVRPSDFGMVAVAPDQAQSVPVAEVGAHPSLSPAPLLHLSWLKRRQLRRRLPAIIQSMRADAAMQLNALGDPPSTNLVVLSDAVTQVRLLADWLRQELARLQDALGITK